LAPSGAIEMLRRPRQTDDAGQETNMTPLSPRLRQATPWRPEARAPRLLPAETLADLPRPEDVAGRGEALA
jgi:hypothetical protein